MLTLAIDTSEDMAAVALGKDGKLLAENHFYNKMSLLRRLLPNIEQMISDAGYTSQDLDGIIVGLGPGSFTGLRIGITTAKALAFALSKPLVGISTLDVIAHGAAPVNAKTICPMIFARADEVYWTLFDSTGSIRISDYLVNGISKAMEAAKSKGEPVCFCGTGAIRNAEKIRHEFGNDALIDNKWSAIPRGAVLLELGNHRLHEGDVDDAARLAPMYIKKPTPVVRLEMGMFEKGKK